ncbi:DUF4435 domain-containing protein [Acinetobacter bereziniae]|uniref:DUF4435 domain-containing protein n=1 Tax=Acinetobacter bereziniae TaxID=106648 RepID=UPI00357114CB
MEDKNAYSVVNVIDKDIGNKPAWGKYTSNLGFFLKDVQDINLYIEDTAIEAENFYKAMLKNILPELKINKVVGLGGRENVLQACTKKKKNVKELYIIDGDLYCYYGNQAPLDNLFIHNAYCVENYLVDSFAVFTFIEDSLAISFEEVIEKCNWNSFYTNMLDSFEDLFILYAICHRLRLPIKTIKRFNTAEWVDHTIKNGFKTPNLLTIKKTAIEIKMYIISEIGESEFHIIYEEIHSRLSDLEANKRLDYISGKNYLIHFLKNFVASLKCPMSSVTDQSFKYRLIKLSRHPELNTLKSAILKVIDEGVYIT